jgi:hypothetical protein
LPTNLQKLIAETARDNPTWGEERIAGELQLKVGLRVSPRTVRKHLHRDRPRGSPDQRWATFVRNHAKVMVACASRFESVLLAMIKNLTIEKQRSL